MAAGSGCSGLAFSIIVQVKGVPDNAETTTRFRADNLRGEIRD